MTKKHFQLWSAVRKIILEHYDLLKDEFLRDAYYIIRDLIAPEQGKAITAEDYNWLLTRQGYASLRDDIWPSLEQKEGLERPRAWPIGIAIDNGVEKLLSSLEENMRLGLEYVWDQARGFIFVEKGGVAKRLQPLSKYGWTIMAGKGYPERLMRKLLKEEKQQRPVLVLHDFDRDGRGIYRALGFETRRTRHLDIALGDRVIDLGLNEDQVTALDLPREPSPPKYSGQLRVELSGLATLKTRMGIENYYLSFVVAAMILKGLTLSPTEVDKRDMMKRHLRWALTDGLKGVIESAIDALAIKMEKEEKFDGDAVEGIAETLDVIAPGLETQLIATGIKLMNETTFRYEKEMDEEARKFTDEKLVDLLKEG